MQLTSWRCEEDLCLFMGVYGSNLYDSQPGDNGQYDL